MLVWIIVAVMTYLISFLSSDVFFFFFCESSSSYSLIERQRHLAAKLGVTALIWIFLCIVCIFTLFWAPGPLPSPLSCITPWWRGRVSGWTGANRRTSFFWRFCLNHTPDASLLEKGTQLLCSEEGCYRDSWFRNRALVRSAASACPSMLLRAAANEA